MIIYVFITAGQVQKQNLKLKHIWEQGGTSQLAPVYREDRLCILLIQNYILIYLQLEMY